MAREDCDGFSAVGVPDDAGSVLSGGGQDLAVRVPSSFADIM